MNDNGEGELSHEGQEKSLTRKLFNEKLCCRGDIDASLSNPRRWKMGRSRRVEGNRVSLLILRGDAKEK